MTIDRKTAEAARRNVIRIDAIRNPEDVDLAVRAECLNVWNSFCTKETARLDRRDLTLKRIARCRNAHLLGRAARLFLVWGSPNLADVAFERLGVVQNMRQPKPMTGKGIPWS